MPSCWIRRCFCKACQQIIWKQMCNNLDHCELICKNTWPPAFQTKELSSQNIETPKNKTNSSPPQNQLKINTQTCTSYTLHKQSRNSAFPTAKPKPVFQQGIHDIDIIYIALYTQKCYPPSSNHGSVWTLDQCGHYMTILYFPCLHSPLRAVRAVARCVSLEPRATQTGPVGRQRWRRRRQQQ